MVYKLRVCTIVKIKENFSFKCKLRTVFNYSRTLYFPNNLDTWLEPFGPRRENVPAFREQRSIHPLVYNFEGNFN